MRFFLPPLLAFPLIVATASGAFAHAHLKSADPGPGSAVVPAPAWVAIDFTEALEPRFSGIEVRNSQGERVDANDAHVAPNDAKQFIVGLKPLPPGTYTVAWHATAVDTHKTEGTFGFTVAPGPVAVITPWARATPGAGTTGAAYATVTDAGAPDRITGASTPVAGSAQLHETVNANGVMQMRAASDASVQPGKPLVMSPGGVHIMLMDLKQPLKQGETFPLTLTFANAAPVTVQVTVAGPGAAVAGAPAEGGHDMAHIDMAVPAAAKP